MIVRRNTKQRQIILDAVRSRCDHPSAEEIYKQVHEIDPKISLGTVYRNLDILVNEGAVKDINLSTSDRYDLKTDNHNHFVCEKCGKIFDIDIEYDKSHDNLKTKDGFIVNSHQTIYNGLCPECANTNRRK